MAHFFQYETRNFLAGRVIDEVNLALVLVVCLGSQIEKRPGNPDPQPSQTTVATLAGEYFLGDGLVNETLNVSASGRFTYEWSADDGGRTGEKGQAKLVDGNDVRYRRRNLMRFMRSRRHSVRPQ